MRNDATCKFMGVGSIWTQMFDGVICTLTNVRYVPAFQKSLISLEAI